MHGCLDPLEGEDNLGNPGIMITQSLDSTQQQWEAKGWSQ